MYTRAEVRTFQSVLKPFVASGLINNEIFTVALSAIKDNLAGSNSQSSATQRDKLISIKEAADILGCCTKTITRLTAKGMLCRIHYGTNSIRYKKSDVLALANCYDDEKGGGDA